MTDQPKVIGFVPCRAGSERVPGKNTRPFAGFEGGLLELKLRQLARLEFLDTILVSSNDPAVLDLSEGFAQSVDPRITPLVRPDHLAASSTSMNDVIAYIADLGRGDDTVFWTHVTHPLVTPAIYRDAFRIWREVQSRGHDALVSVTTLQKFIWDENGPVNYDNTVEKWPRSQDLKKLYEMNHALYVMPFGVMKETGDRVGRHPYFFDIDEGAAMDIDWPHQFELLDKLVRIEGVAAEVRGPSGTA